MALTRAHKIIMERAHEDPAFRLALLKEILKEAIKRDPDLLEKAVEKLEEKSKRK